MTQNARQSKKARIIPVVLGAGALLASFVMPDAGGIDRNGWAALAIVVFAVVFWTTETLPGPATGMAILILIPLMGVMGYQETFSYLGTTMLWRLMGISILAFAVQKVGLADRLAYGMLLLTRGKVKSLLFCMLSLNFILSFILPSAFARTALLTTLIASYLQTAEISKQARLGKAFMVSLPAASNITTSAIMVGASVDIFAVQMFETLIGYKWTFVTWMVANVPFCLIMTLVIFAITLLVFPPEQKQLMYGDLEIRKKLKELGPMKSPEWYVVAVFVLLMVLWFTDISEKMPAEMLAALLFVIPHRLRPLKWKEAVVAVKWDILLLFGASIAMSAALQKSGAAGWLAEALFSQLSGMSPIFLVAFTATMTVLVRLGMTNMTGAVAILLPLLVSIATRIGINPVWLGMVCVISSTASFIYPAQSVNSLFAYKFGYFETRHFMKFGIVVSLMLIVVILGIATIYWPLVGLSIYS